MFHSRRGFLVLGCAAAALAGCSTFGPSIKPDGSTTPPELTTDRILAAINGTRKKYGEGPLSYNFALETAARTHAQLMASKDILSHELGGTLRERVNVVGFRGALGENLASGHDTLESAIVGWLNSPGHRSTLLSPKWTEFGLAAAVSRGGKEYWAFIAGGPVANWFPG
jgi:uncharacterized protein YkwD